MIERQQAQHIQELIAYFPAVGLVGPRQVGKTTLVKALAAEWPQESVYWLRPQWRVCNPNELQHQLQALGLCTP